MYKPDVAQDNRILWDLIAHVCAILRDKVRWGCGDSNILEFIFIVALEMGRWTCLQGLNCANEASP